MSEPEPEVTVIELSPAAFAECKALNEYWIVAGYSKREVRAWVGRRNSRQRGWAVQNALRDWLKTYPWEWFGHLTFQSCPSLAYAKRAVGRYFNELSRRAWGRNYSKRTNEGLYAFVAYERQKRGDWHAHFVAAGTCGMNQFDAMELWSGRHGWARIYVFDAERGGVAYATKYATKEIDGDYSLIGRWRMIEGLPLLRSHGKA